MRPFSLILLSAALAGSGACTKDNGCEAALLRIQSSTVLVCAEEGYKESSFCRICVDRGFYSTTGPTDCYCKLLAFDAPYCTYPGDDELRAGVRADIAKATQTCKAFSLPPDGGSLLDDGGAADGSSSAELSQALSQ